jgi:hypothetical protein
MFASVASVLVLLAASVESHVKLYYFPNQFPIRNARTATVDGTFSVNTTDGCGGQPMFGKNGVSYFRVGQKINMTFNYGTTVNGDHKSASNAFRIVWASLDASTNVAGDISALKAGAVLQSNIAAAEGSRPVPYSALVTIPAAAANCKRCVLQAIEQRSWGACYDFTTIAPTSVTPRPTTTVVAPTTRPVTTAAPTTRPVTTVPPRTSPLPPGATTAKPAATTTTAAMPRQTTTVAAPAVCGNGKVESGEQCEPDDGACCRADCKFAPQGIICRTKMATLACDVADVCSGDSAECVDAVADAGTVCRAANSADTCVGDAVCDGSLAACPSTNPIAVGRPCDDGESCTQGDACSRLGACVGVYTCKCTTDAQCDTDRDSCTADLCNKDGVCNRDDSMDKMEGASCTDGDECTMGDTCTAEGVCVGKTQCNKAGANACMANEKHGKCCGDKCICNAGWIGDNCETVAPACAEGNTGCACAANDACMGELKCAVGGEGKKVCLASLIGSEAPIDTDAATPTALLSLSAVATAAILAL